MRTVILDGRAGLQGDAALCEKLARHLLARLDEYREEGIQVDAALNREQEGQALGAMRDLVCELADHGPTQEELDRVREQAKANLLMGSESIQSRMSQLGASALLYGRVRETEELLAQYDAVTRQQLRDLAQNIFQMDLASLSAVGRVSGTEEYASLLRG